MGISSRIKRCEKQIDLQVHLFDLPGLCSVKREAVGVLAQQPGTSRAAAGTRMTHCLLLISTPKQGN